MKKIVLSILLLVFILISCRHRDNFYTLQFEPIKTFCVVIQDSIKTSPKCGLALSIDKSTGDTNVVFATKKYIVLSKLNDTVKVIDTFNYHVRFQRKCVITDSAIIHITAEGINFRFYDGRERTYQLPVNNSKKQFFDFLLWGQGFIKGDTLVFESKSWDASNKNETVYFYNYQNGNITDSLQIDFLIKDVQLKVLFYYLIGKEFYYTNRYSDSVFVYNLEQKTNGVFVARSNVIEDIPVVNFDEFRSPRYSELIYDYRNHIIWRRFIFKKGNISDRWTEGVILIKDQEKIGEFIAPDTIKLTPCFFINGDEVLLFSGIYGDKIKFTIYKFTYKPIKYNRWYSENKSLNSSIYGQTCAIKADTNLNQKQLLVYFRSIGQKVHDGLFIVLPVRYSCPECIQIAQKFININKNFLRKKGVRVIIINKADKNSEFRDNKFVILDSSEVFYDYFSLETYNPMILIFRDGKLTFHRVYTPDKMEDFQLDIINYLGASAEKE